MKKFYLLLFTLLLFSCGKSNEEEEKVDVMEIQNIGLLATSEYTIGKVIELKDEGAWYKFGDRNILISCKAKVKAGINLGEITAQDIEIKGNSIKITLPYPQIITFDMDPNTIQTEVQDINGFRQSFSQEEKNEILSQGEKAIKSQMKGTHILESAKQNATVFIKNFYKELDYEHVEIIFKQALQQEIKSY